MEKIIEVPVVMCPSQPDLKPIFLLYLFLIRGIVDNSCDFGGWYLFCGSGLLGGARLRFGPCRCCTDLGFGRGYRSDYYSLFANLYRSLRHHRTVSRIFHIFGDYGEVTLGLKFFDVLPLYGYFAGQVALEFDLSSGGVQQFARLACRRS